MAGVDPEWSHSMAHALARDARTWPRGDVPGLGLIDEDVDLLRGEDVTPSPGLNRINRRLIPTSCNFFPEAHLQRTLKLSVLGLEQFRDG